MLIENVKQCIRKFLFAFLLIFLMLSPKPTVMLTSIEQCSGVNILGSEDLIFYYVRSAKYIQQTIFENLNEMQTGSGKGISWANMSYNENSYTLQIRFKHYLVMCCMAINNTFTNVQEYEVKLLDKSGMPILAAQQANDAIRYTSNANLFVDMTHNHMGSYGVDIIVKRTNQFNAPPENVDITMILCEKTSNVSEKLRQQQLAQNQIKDSLLLDKCTNDDQCDKLIIGKAVCLNETCKCASGVEQNNKYQCSVSVEDIEKLSFGSQNINYNFLNKSQNQSVSFYEINHIECMQNKDCQSTFLDLNMLCVNQTCVCSLGYRIVQDPVNFKVKCLKAIDGAELKYPQGCDVTFCEFHLLLFVFDLGSLLPSPPLTPQRVISLTLITDHHFYLREFYQVIFNDEKLKFFIDNNDIMTVVLGEKFFKLYRTLSQIDSLKGRSSKISLKSSMNEPILVRKPRYVIQSLVNTTNNITKETTNDIIIYYDPEEYRFLNRYINYWYMDAGNVTYYNFEFNTNFSSFILNSMFTPSMAPSSSGANDSCLIFKLIRGNYVQMTPNSNAPTKTPFFFESKHMTRLNGFLFCLNLNQNESSKANSSQSACKNGVQLYDSKYPMSSLQLNQSKYGCHCWTGYWGPQCETVNPCYTMLTNSSYVPNATEPLPILTKSCINDGICMPMKSPAFYYYMNGLKYVPYCLCRPQFTGKSCERNIDGCVFPFMYGNKLHNKCQVNQTTGTTWCGKSYNIDNELRNTTTCTAIPCKIPWKYQNLVYYSKCIYKRYQDEKGFYESPICSLTRNYELFRTWRYCEQDDFS